MRDRGRAREQSGEAERGRKRRKMQTRKKHNTDTHVAQKTKNKREAYYRAGTRGGVGSPAPHQ